MKLLITGTTTLLGSQVLDRFQKYYSDVQISTLDDLSDAAAVSTFFEVNQFDAVIHLASVYQAEHIGTKNLLDAANTAWQGLHLLRRFMYVSCEDEVRNNSLLKKYSQMTLVISSCQDCFASSDFPLAYVSLAQEKISEKKPVPLYVAGQTVPEWFWVADEACAIDVVFHQGEAGLLYSVGGMNAFKNISTMNDIASMGHVYANSESTSHSYSTLFSKILNIFRKLATN